LPRVSVELAYNRRAWGNFLVTDNRALGPQDFTKTTIICADQCEVARRGGKPVSFWVQTPTNFGAAGQLPDLL
jgi:hypothetical protein